MPFYSKPEWITWDPEATYTAKEMEILADQFLRTQADSIDPTTGKRVGIKETDTLPAILFESHIRDRKRREIITKDGTPDPAYTRDPRFPNQVPLYNRTHPQGRKVSTPEQRKESGSSFFL